jgi:hypothetical protein
MLAFTLTVLVLAGLAYRWQARRSGARLQFSEMLAPSAEKPLVPGAP